MSETGTSTFHNHFGLMVLVPPQFHRDDGGAQSRVEDHMTMGCSPFPEPPSVICGQAERVIRLKGQATRRRSHKDVQKPQKSCR
jgi:hypothetical protein